MPGFAPKLAVVIPTYDREKTLPRAVASVQAQSLKDIEILICDDCSKDDTAQLIANLSELDPRIRYIRTRVNSGPATARDLGIKASTADYIATLDSDDIYLSRAKLERELDVVVRNSTPERAAIGFSKRILLDADMRPLPHYLQPSSALKEGDILQPLMGRALEIPLDFTFPKASYFEVGGYDPEIAMYEDWDLKIRLARKANFYFTGVDGTGYVQHAEGLSKSSPEEHQAWLGHVFRKNINLLRPSSQEAARSEFRKFAAQRGWECQSVVTERITERQRLGEGLIFLLSLPRSGSTLVQRMIATHSDIYTNSESWLMLPILSARLPDVIFSQYDHRIATRALNDFISELPGGEQSYQYWVRTCYAGLYQDQLKSSGARFFLDKTPRYHIIAMELMRLFPRAKFILLWRHPLDMLRSICEAVNFDTENFDSWAIDVRDGLINLALARDTGKALEVFYEDIVNNPEIEMRRIADYLRIPFQSSMVNPAHDDVAKEWRYGDRKIHRSGGAPKGQSIRRWPDAINTHPEFSLLADRFLRYNASTIKKLRYDFEEMRRLVPQSDPPKTESIFVKHDKSYYRRIAYREPHIAELWRSRLVRLGPVPYAIGRTAWRTFKRLALTRRDIFG